MQYLLLDKNGVLESLTEADWLKYVGDKEQMGYASQVYAKEISIADVPEALQAGVQKVVDAKIERWGEYIPPEKTTEEQLAEAQEALRILGVK